MEAVRISGFPLLFLPSNANQLVENEATCVYDGSVVIQLDDGSRRGARERRIKMGRPAGVFRFDSNVANGRAARLSVEKSREREMERTFGILPSALYICLL